jgi:hypothetical protein
LLVCGGLVLAGRRTPRRVPPNAVAVLGALCLGALLAPASNGYIERYTKVPHSTAPGTGVVAWVVSQPGFDEADSTVAFAARAAFGPLTGDHFTNRLELIPRRASCREVAGLARHSWVVLVDESWFSGILGVVPYEPARCLKGSVPAYRDGVYRVYRPEPGSR